jgi:hypothetical protein
MLANTTAAQQNKILFSDPGMSIIKYNGDFYH